MTLRYELASLLAGFDVARFREERDEAVVMLRDFTVVREALGPDVVEVACGCDRCERAIFGATSEHEPETLCGGCACDPNACECAHRHAHTFLSRVGDFMCRLPIGAVDAARARLGKR
jgi:hypothetical protein